MTMPHKICPQCGQPAVPTMPQCRRCGFVYAPGPPFAPPRTSAGGPSRELPAAQRQGPPARSRFGPLLLLVALGCGVLVLATLARVVTSEARRKTAFPDGRLPGSSGLNAAPADASAPPAKLSFFAESESRQEMPTLTFRNWEDFTLTVTLRDKYGHVYRASSAAEQVATMQVPAGDYSVSLDCDNPHVRPNWGDATFRKFKAYHSDFGVGRGAPRIHLGD